MRTGLLGRAGKAALDFLLPLYCVECRREGRGVCKECLAGMMELRAYCEICAQPGSARRCRRCVVTPLPISGIRAVYPFEGVIRSAVHALKYRNYRALAPELADILARRLDDDDIPATLLVPVPMHPPAREESRLQSGRTAGQRAWQIDRRSGGEGGSGTACRFSAASSAWNAGGSYGDSGGNFLDYDNR